MINTLKNMYDLNDEYRLTPVEAHEGGRNMVFICVRLGTPSFVIRVSTIGDRREEEYLAETEFVHFLAKGGASVADVIPSVNGKLVETVRDSQGTAFVSCFEYARGMLISDNGYQYREGSPLSEYFFNTGKTLGKIHNLSKKYPTDNRRSDYFDKYNMTYIDGLLSEEYAGLKSAISRRLEIYKSIERNEDEYGLVHFDFSDGNYHIDMQTGNITVFDFDNCMYCWYMFDLANLWTHGAYSAPSGS